MNIVQNIDLERALKVSEKRALNTSNTRDFNCV